MRALIRALPTMLRVDSSLMVTYRGEVVLWALWGLVYPAVSMVMWQAAGSGAGGGTLAGFTSSDIAAYFILSMVVGHLTSAWDVYEMGYLIRSGTLSARLLRPIWPLWESVAGNIAYKVVTLTLLLPIWAAFWWWCRPTLTASPGIFAAGCAATLLAAVLAYVWGYAIAMLAFYVTKMEAIAELYFGITLFLSGKFAAIDWLPAPIQWMTYAFPFRWTIAFPVEALMGRLSMADALAGLLWQAGWLVVGIAVLRTAWSRAIQRYSAVGG